MTQYIEIQSPEEHEILHALEKREDLEAKRIKRYLSMPDLSRASESPLKDIVDRIKQIPLFRDFDDINIPEIVPTDILFDLFNMPPEHPARSTSDTYYVTEDHVLRTHDTVMWHYYLTHPSIKAKIANNEDVGVICYGKVYRKDEIDRRHMNVFHQFGGLYLTPDIRKIVTSEDLQGVLADIAKSVFGSDVKYRFNADNFPYTDPSYEMEIEVKGQWIEMLGCGLPRKTVLANFGVTGYNGWAFGFGLERLAIVSMELPDIRLLWSEDPRVKKQLKLGNKFVEVSKYPPVMRDISFVVSKEFVPNNYFDLIRELGGDLIEQVELIDKYEDAGKFGADKISYTYRITYRSNERTLVSSEVDAIQDQVYKQTAELYKAELR